MKRILFLIAIFFNVVNIRAQSPEGFKYQAVLRNSANSILNNQGVGIQIKIQQGSIGGVTVYSETFSTITNANGLVNLEIGNGLVTSGDFSSINWANGPYFIETAVDIAGGNNFVVMGASQLLSVPYALYAKTSGSSTPGPAGPQGIQGIAGSNGLSAYELAVVNGFVGSEGDWIASLKGPQGSQGIQGPAGSNGLSAYELAVANGFVGSEADWITSLEGPQGSPGTQGPAGLLLNGSAIGNTPFWNGMDWVVNNSNIHNDGGSVGIGTTTPNSASKLEISSQTQGFLPPRMTFEQRDAITNPVDGLMIFNTSSGCPNYYFNGSWYEWCGSSTSPSATITSLLCNSASTTGNLLMSVPSFNKTITLPYVGGNGGAYSAQAIASTGVNGLTASLDSGVLGNGAGNLTYTISGTPDNSGTASFQVSLAGKNCVLTLNVGLPAPSIISSNPTSPSNNSTTPILVIFGPANKTIELFNNSTGTGVPIATATTDNSGNASIVVSVNSNSTSTFTAIASDGQGNVSALSNSFTYTHNSITPTTPTIESVSPVSPSRLSTNPTLLVSGAPGSLISVFNNTSCSGIALATAIVGANGTVSIPVNVTSNSSTSFTAHASQNGMVSLCSNVLTYVHDNSIPNAPIPVSTNPLSPGISTNPTFNYTAEPFSVIRLYTDATCINSTGCFSLTSALGNASIPCSVLSNYTTTLYANATDAAGNTSPCSASLTYIADNIAPSATITSSSPTSPNSSSINPNLSINSEIGATIFLYSGNTCSGAPLNTISMVNSVQSVNVTVSANSTSNFTVKARDAAGNIGACSSAFSYTHDDLAPSAPTISGSIPLSPSNSSTTPTLNINAESGSLVFIYSGNSCGGAPLNAGALATGGVASVSVNAASNATTTFSAKARDSAGNYSSCSPAFSYVNDVIAPYAPSIISSTPSSPSAASTTPKLNITNAEAGADILIYSGNTCSGAVISTISNASMSTSATVSVTANSTSSFSARTRDAAGNLSTCSSAFSYTHDSSPPIAPVIYESIPSSPGSAITPTIKISCEPNATVNVYGNATATGAPIASGIAGATGEVWFGNIYFGPITVGNGSMNKFTAKATDACGNTSPASGIFDYNHIFDNTPPGSAFINQCIPSSPGNSTSPQLRIFCEPGATVNLYNNLTASGAPIGTYYDVNFDGELWITITVSSNSTNKLSVRQTDASGNVSQFFDTFTYVHSP